MTRDIDWGIPVPGWEDQPTKRLYVWFDAVIGYLSASIEWARARTSGRPGRLARVVERPGRPVLLLHGQGQHRLPLPDLARRAAGLRRPRLARRRAGGRTATSTCPPRSSPRSTSRWATSSSPPAAATCSTSATSWPATARTPLRYYICAAGPETSDAAFTWADFVTRNNSELVAGWGNLVNRTATMVAKSFGEIPPARDLEPVDEAVLAAVRGGFDTVGDLIGHHRLRAAIAEAMRVVGEVNKYLTVTEPYKMKDESQRERLATVLHVAAQCVSRLQHAAVALPAARRQQGAPGARRRGRARADAAHRAGRGARPRQRRRAHVLPRDHRRLHRHARAGSPDR